MRYLLDHQLPSRFVIFEDAPGIRTIAECDSENNAKLVQSALNFYNEGN